MTTLTAPGRHRDRGLVLPRSPGDEERESYAWRALPFLTIALFISSLSIMLAQALMEIRNATILPVAAAFFGTYTLIYLVYQLVSLPVNFTGRSFDLTAHDALVSSWRPERYPDVDIYLPICGEPIPVLRNTWEGVSELIGAYPGRAEAFVLDDGDDDDAARLARWLGLTYIRRPVHEYKKSGNLNYAFARTSGEHVVVFDADFRPRCDFLAETLPYLDDPDIGLVQTPQFFRASQRQTWVERAAGATLEVFYRAVQVSRDRFGSALCVGSNCVYRRAALAPNGGFTVIPYAEDSHTGLDARRYGYYLTYVPVPLAAGICPGNIDAFMRQQYRWCCGASSLLWTRHMWSVPMPWRSRLPYVAGWLWNFTTALRTLILPLFPITLLAFLPGEIQLRNALLLVPAIITGTVLYPLWHNIAYSPRVWPLSLAVGWAQILALWDFSRGKVMSWQATRGPGDTPRRFWWGVALWNGTLAVVWLALAGWRIEQTGSVRFAIVAVFGLLNALTVGRLIFPGRKAS
jgi:cellulose synthase/poly-beta-1,6-N-acetylglucosamine synthase-like glycosyltransferase